MKRPEVAAIAAMKVLGKKLRDTVGTSSSSPNGFVSTRRTVFFPVVVVIEFGLAAVFSSNDPLSFPLESQSPPSPPSSTKPSSTTMPASTPPVALLLPSTLLLLPPPKLISSAGTLPSLLSSPPPRLLLSISLLLYYTLDLSILTAANDI